MSVNHYDYNDSTQLSPHFNVKEFRCQCGQSHETLIASKLVGKLEQLYTALNCSKIIVTSGYRCPEHDKAEAVRAAVSIPKALLRMSAATGKMGSQSAARRYAVKLRIWALAVLLTSRHLTSTRIWTCGQDTAG